MKLSCLRIPWAVRARAILLLPIAVLAPTLGAPLDSCAVPQMLYDLVDDIAATRPARVVRMESEIASWNKTLSQPQWPESKHSAVDFDGQSLELFY